MAISLLSGEIAGSLNDGSGSTGVSTADRCTAVDPGRAANAASISSAMATALNPTLGLRVRPSVTRILLVESLVNML